MTLRRLLLLFGVVAAALLVGLAATNAAYQATTGNEDQSHHAVASERTRTREVGVHAAVVKTQRSERLLRLGLAVLGAGLAALALRGRRTSPVRLDGGRLGFAAGALGRG